MHNLVLRASVQNLLRRSKVEEFRKYDGDSYDQILATRAAGDIDAVELEANARDRSTS